MRDEIASLRKETAWKVEMCKNQVKDALSSQL